MGKILSGMVSFTVMAVLLWMGVPSVAFAANNFGGEIEFQGHRYKLFDLGMTWRRAEQYCEGLGGHLATIQSNAEQEIMERLLAQGTRNSYWIGGYKSHDGRWHWVTKEAVSYSHWANGEPNNANGRENTMMMFRNIYPGSPVRFGTWNDLASDGVLNSWDTFYGIQNLGFICEWDENKESKEANPGYQPVGKQKLKKLVGTYQGSYFPTQGETGLTLTVFEEDGEYKALFEFYSLPGKNNSQSGSYYMSVSYDESSELYILKGERWIDRPGVYVFADLKGVLVNDVLTGTTPWRFRVHRVQW